MSEGLDASQWGAGAAVLPFQPRESATPRVTFDGRELRVILRTYGHMVAAGEWRDYALDFLRDKAVFSVFRRSTEAPLYRIEKTPKTARAQGAYAIVAPGGRVLKRGHDLETVLRLFERRLSVVG